MATHLPDPEWIQTLPGCPGCGYNLNGLNTPITCPECGFQVDDKTMVLSGVVKTDATQSPYRRALWIVIFVLGILMLYGWPFLILIGWSGLILFLLWLGTLIALLATSKRSRAGKMKIIVASSGFLVVADLHQDQHEGTPVHWDRVRSVRWEKVSPVWYRLRMWSDKGKLLEAGVRCPEELASLVYDTINWHHHDRYLSSTASTQIGPSGVS